MPPSLKSELDHRIEGILPELTAIRHDLHAHPEIGKEEHRTAELVARSMRSWNIDVTEHVGGLGVVGTLRGRRQGARSVGLRADMDALAIPEQTGLPYASKHAGLMHACGHDGHTTMLLGAARLLAEHPEFGGTVHFIFQPAEEGLGGAQAMVDDGLFRRFPCDEVYGLHNMPGIPVGRIALRTGPFMAGSGRWRVRFEGTGGHGGNSPHLATDLTVALAFFIQHLQTVVSRDISALTPAVISVGHIQTGEPNALNVMPAKALAGGTMRAFEPDVQSLIEKGIRRSATLAAESQRATAAVEIWWNAIPLVNAADQADKAAAAARSAIGDDGVTADAPPVTAAEDFAFMLKERPGSFVFLGNGSPEEGTVHELHTPSHDFNDDAIPHGICYWISLVNHVLKPS